MTPNSGPKSRFWQQWRLHRGNQQWPSEKPRRWAFVSLTLTKHSKLGTCKSPTFIKMVERLISHSLEGVSLPTTSGCPRTVQDISLPRTLYFMILQPTYQQVFCFLSPGHDCIFGRGPQNGFKIVALASLEPTFLMWFMLNNEVPVHKVSRNWMYILAKQWTGTIPFAPLNQPSKKHSKLVLI